jgi:hypothetical protein
MSGGNSGRSRLTQADGPGSGTALRHPAGNKQHSGSKSQRRIASASLPNLRPHPFRNETDMDGPSPEIGGRAA